MSTPRRKPAPQAIDLEKTLAELEAIVEQLESGDLSLDKSLKEFERGVRLSRECQGALKAAEQRVQALMGGELKDFPTDDAGAEENASGPDDDEEDQED